MFFNSGRRDIKDRIVLGDRAVEVLKRILSSCHDSSALIEEIQAGMTLADLGCLFPSAQRTICSGLSLTKSEKVSSKKIVLAFANPGHLKVILESIKQRYPDLSLDKKIPFPPFALTFAQYLFLHLLLPCQHYEGRISFDGRCDTIEITGLKLPKGLYRQQYLFLHMGQFFYPGHLKAKTGLSDHRNIIRELNTDRLFQGVLQSIQRHCNNIVDCSVFNTQSSNR